MNKTQMITFLREMAESLEKEAAESKEDKAFWAHCNNADNCNKVAQYLEDTDT